MEDERQKHLLEASPSRRGTRPVEGGEGNHGAVPAWLAFLRDALQHVGEQVRRVLCPIAVQILEHARQRPGALPSNPHAVHEEEEEEEEEEEAAATAAMHDQWENDEEEKMEFLSTQNRELQERIAAAEARLAAEQAARRDLQRRAVALQGAVERAMREEEEEMEVIRKGLDETSEDLRVKLADLERTRLEGLSQVQQTMSENRLALSRLTQEANSALSHVSRLIKNGS